MRSVISSVFSDYDMEVQSFKNISGKSGYLMCKNNHCYFIKKTNISSDEKYKFLHSQQVNNVLYPLVNKKGNYTSNSLDNPYYIMPFEETNRMIDEVKINHFYQELSNLHLNTYYRKELTPFDSKKKLENIYYYLEYKFNILETFVRSIEERSYDEYSILILKNYQYVLTTKSLLSKYNRLIIEDIKNKKSVNRSFIHNNPKMEHLINSNGLDYFISLERSKIGVPSLDMAKFYIETEEININHKELIDNYFKQYNDDFYFNYFYFLVMLYYIKSIVINEKDYVSSQSFVYAGVALKKFQNTFNLSF